MWGGVTSEILRAIQRIADSRYLVNINLWINVISYISIVGHGSQRHFTLRTDLSVLFRKIEEGKFRSLPLKRAETVNV